jgi:hypothetical protein
MNLAGAGAVEAVELELVDEALGVEVVLDEALGGVVVDDAPGDALGDAFGVDGEVAAGGEDVDGEASFCVDVCASALVNASALTAATAMTCFNMSASWGDVSEIQRSPVGSGVPGATPRG